MRSNLFHPSVEGEARLLLLIHAFSGPERSLEGRTKLAKLDFFLRYPPYFARALAVRGAARLTNTVRAAIERATAEGHTVESRMVRYRYGPWDPAYFALLGRLVGKNLVEPVSESRGLGYRTTTRGASLATQLASTPEWESTAERAVLLRRFFDVTGERLKQFVYEQFPEVAGATWGEHL